jgi:hypothetical protein
MYKLQPNNFHGNKPQVVFRTADCAWIPFDPANTDYAAYLEWVEAGNTPEPALEPVAPVELTTEQKLEAAGLSVDELKILFGLT